MSANFRVDISGFVEPLRKVAASSPLPLSQFITKRLYFVGKEAQRLTPIASRPKIQTDLGAELTRARVSKNGKIRRTYKYSPTPLVYALMNARRRKAGKPPIPRAEMASAAKKLIASRLRAVGSLRSGWTRGIVQLGKNVGQFLGFDGPRIKNASIGVPARPGWNPQASLEYRLTVGHGGGRSIDPRVTPALQGGFEKEKAELISKLEKEVGGLLKKAGAL
jgi:hypothetical protein